MKKYTIFVVIVLLIGVLVEHSSIESEAKINIGTSLLSEVKEIENKVIDDMFRKLSSRSLVLILDNEEVKINFLELIRVNGNLSSRIINYYVRNKRSLISDETFIYRYLSEINKINDVDCYWLDKEKVREVLVDRLRVFNVKPVNAEMIWGTVILHKEEKQGRSVLINDLIEDVLSMNDIKTTILEVPIVNLEPKISTKDLIDVNDILGEYRTYFDSSSARKFNLINAVRLLNSTIVMPGDVFSAQKTLGEFTVNNGYDLGNAFSSDGIVESIGGGICQVTTTLYNAILYSGLEVVERHPHRFYVNYVELGRDAAISDKYKDLKFKNTTSNPIYIYANITNNEISIKIIGKQLSDGVSYEFYTVKTLAIAPGDDIVEVDITKSKGFYELVHDYRYGYDVELHCSVIKGSKVIDQIVINHSRYKPLNKKIRIGH